MDKKMSKLHKAYVRAEIAERYYSRVYPERGYTRAQARKQFNQDLKKDPKILGDIVLEIFNEQTKLLSK